MINSFFKSSKTIIVGSKPANRASIRKMISALGCENRNLEISITIGEALVEIQGNLYNILIFDDDCKDLSEIDKLIGCFHKNLRESENSLLIIICTISNSPKLQKYLDNEQSILINKPYTIGSFSNEIDIFLNKREEVLQNKLKKHQKQIKITKKAKKAYFEFSKYITKSTFEDSEDNFLGLCRHFLKSLDGQIDYESLSKILSEGIVSQRFKDLDLFVEGWIDSIPIDSLHIPNISRVLLYNNKFELFEKLKTKDEKGKMAIGVGMVLSASVIYKDDSKKDLVLEYIQTGIRLTKFKPLVVYSGLETLLKINATNEAKEIVKSADIFSCQEMEPKVKESFQHLIDKIFA